jgi:hypothetical protein
MIRTIRIGRHLLVQGRMIGQTACGRLTVLVDSREFTGYPVA